MYPDKAQRLSSRCRPQSRTDSSWRFHSPTIDGVAKWSGDATRSWASSLPNITYVGLRARGRARRGRSRNAPIGRQKPGCSLSVAPPRSSGNDRTRTLSSRETSLWVRSSLNSGHPTPAWACSFCARSGSGPIRLPHRRERSASATIQGRGLWPS